MGAAAGITGCAAGRVGELVFFCCETVAALSCFLLFPFPALCKFRIAANIYHICNKLLPGDSCTDGLDILCEAAVETCIWKHPPGWQQALPGKPCCVVEAMAGTAQELRNSPTSACAH